MFWAMMQPWELLFGVASNLLCYLFNCSGFLDSRQSFNSPYL